MNYISPNGNDEFLTVCENCKAIICCSRDDLYCIKQVDCAALQKGEFQNIEKVYITCPNCQSEQDVIHGMKFIMNR